MKLTVSPLSKHPISMQASLPSKPQQTKARIAAPSSTIQPSPTFAATVDAPVYGEQFEHLRALKNLRTQMRRVARAEMRDARHGTAPTDGSWSTIFYPLVHGPNGLDDAKVDMSRHLNFEYKPDGQDELLYVYYAPVTDRHGWALQRTGARLVKQAKAWAERHFGDQSRAADEERPTPRPKFREEEAVRVLMNLGDGDGFGTLKEAPRMLPMGADATPFSETMAHKEVNAFLGRVTRGEESVIESARQREFQPLKKA